MEEGGYATRMDPLSTYIKIERKSLCPWQLRRYLSLISCWTDTGKQMFTNVYQDCDARCPIRYYFNGKLFGLRRLQAKWASLWENRLFAYAKTKTQISCAVTAQLISAFVFAIRIVQSLNFLNPKFQASSRLLWLHSPVCVGPGRKRRRLVFSQRG